VCYIVGVSIAENDPTKAVRFPLTQSEEQRLCNEALDSHEFDAISDEQWVQMCEQAAAGARQVAEAAVTEQTPK